MIQSHRLSWILIACTGLCSQSALAKFELVRKDPPPSLSSNPHPPTPIHDAVEIQRVSLFPDHVAKRIRDVLSSGDGAAEQARQVRAAVCEGSKPRYAPRYTVRFVAPQAESGIPVDKAAAQAKDLTENARLYIKKFFIDELSNTEIGEKYFDTGYEAFLKKISGDDQASGAHVPVLVFRSQPEIDNYFRAVHYVPGVRSSLDANSATFTLEELKADFLSIVLPEERKAILSVKVVPTLSGAWSRSGETINASSLKLVGASVLHRDRQPVRQFIHFSPSPYVWTINRNHEEGVSLHPLRFAYMEDLAALKRLFTFRLPESVITNELKVLLPSEQQNLGYDARAKKFSPSLATKNQALIWRHLLFRTTMMREVALHDGSIAFELAPSFDAFCRYSVAAADLFVP